MATLYIVRGLPGSGKSTLASRLVHETRHREADMFFMVSGEYKFDPKQLKDAHAWCFDEVKTLLSKEQADCVVSNTFTRRWEYEPYIKLAKDYGYNIMVIDCHSDFSNEVITRLRGQLQNCVNHLDRAKRKTYGLNLDECIESANKALYETIST